MNGVYSTVYKEEKIKVLDWDINYLKVGNGPHNLLLMPGALGTIWTNFKVQLEGLNLDLFTIIAWDPPGHGKSRPLLKEFPPNLYEVEAQYAYELMKVLNIPKFSMFGMCVGGTVGMIVAATHPEVVDKLVVTGSNAFMTPKDINSHLEVKDINVWPSYAREIMTGVYGDSFGPYWALWVEGMVNLFKVRYADFCSKLLKDIKCPTLIIYGAQDHVVESIHVTYLLTHIEGSSKVIYPEDGHYVHIMQADDVNRKITEFLLGLGA